jgi:hypothetical protein
MPSRRQFLSTIAAAVAAPLARADALVRPAARVVPSLPNPAIRWHGESAFSLGLRAGAFAQYPVRQRRNPHPPVDWTTAGTALRRSFKDLRRHFAFEYYPWYGTNPWRHWDQSERHPPVDIAATSMPLLGPYDSRSAAIVEQHARWIADSGIGAINISWWGRGSYEDRAVPLIMDVMRDHDIHVTFHLEPYRSDRVADYSDDIVYLLREYGEKRRWDCFLLVENAEGDVGPIFKSFRTIVPPTTTDCHGVVHALPDYVADTVWRRQTDTVRTTVRREFDHITMLADVSDVGRMQTAGFDGMAIYDNFVLPSTWAPLADACTSRDLVFSFNANPGFDGIHLRTVAPSSCYTPSPITPEGTYSWSSAHDREKLMDASMARIQETFRTTVNLQTAPGSANPRHGFFFVYVNSFNEWHEGHQFEPMKNAADLTPDEQQLGYHNAPDGMYRLDAVSSLLDLVLGSNTAR